MTNEELHNEARESYRAQHIKYTYYIIALSVAAIAFTVHQTFELKIKITQIPLGLAISCWIFIIYNGLSFLQGNLKFLADNILLFEMLKQLPYAMDNQEVSKLFLETLGPLSKRNEKKPKMQLYSFYLAIIFFISWRVIEMISI